MKRLQQSYQFRASNSLEYIDLSANRKLLTMMADLSGGKMIEPEEIHLIPDFFKKEVSPKSQQEEVELWDHWLIMLVFFVLLTTEWVLRKVNGLP